MFNAFYYRGSPIPHNIDQNVLGLDFVGEEKFHVGIIDLLDAYKPVEGFFDLCEGYVFAVHDDF